VKAPLRAAHGYSPSCEEHVQQRLSRRTPGQPCAAGRCRRASGSQRADLDTERRARRRQGAPPLSAAAPPAATSYLGARSTSRCL